MFAFIIILYCMSFSIVNNSIIDLGVKDPNNFGPYYVNNTRFDCCSGPLSRNLTRNVVTTRSTGKAFYFHLNLTFLVPTRIDEMKMAVYSENNNKIGSELWTYKMKNPCKHFVFSGIINNFLKSSNCFANKGSYVQVFNFSEITETFFGTSFFYGRFLLKVTVISKIGNLMCFLIGMAFTKKSEKIN